MQPHAGVQVVIVGLAGHVGHGEVYHRAVGDGHCRGHRHTKTDGQAANHCKDGLQCQHDRLRTVCIFLIFASRDAQLIGQ